MKKLLLAAAAALVAFAAPAKTADELRVYINPGHGSYTPNDRPMPILGHGAYSRLNTDTTSFFESNTNLRKGFGVLEKLREFGLKYDPTLNQTGDRHQIGAARDMSNNIVMSHVKCGPFHEDNGTENQLTEEHKPVPEDLYWYNRSLPEICVEVDANNFDMFISIHSNAVDASGWKTTNFPIVLYRGYDDVTTNKEGLDPELVATNKKMGQAIWPYHMGNIHEGWTAYSATNMNVRGDCNFYASPSLNSRGYFGYLGVLKHGVPGFLVEGYFHQYAPAALRHMNWDVNYIEGYNYAHGIADFFGLAKEKTGDIYGIVRDEHEKFDDPDYKAIPGTDDMYKPLNNVTVTLKKNGNAVATYTTDAQYNGAFVFKGVEPGDYTLSFAAEGYKTPKAVAVTVKAAEVSYPKAFMESESYVPPTVVYSNYPDVLKGTTFGAREEYNFAVTDTKQIAELTGKTIKRLIVHEGNLYVLALTAEGAPEIYVLDGKTFAVLAQPSVEGTEGTVRGVSDIQVTADHVLIACAEELCHYDAGQVQEGETRGECNIYKWTNDPETGFPAGAPALWFTTQKSGNFYRATTGKVMFYSGTTDEGTLVMSSVTTASSGKIFLSLVTVISGGKASDEHRNNAEANPDDMSVFIEGTLGTYSFVTSPLNDKNFVIASTNLPYMEYSLGVGAKGLKCEGTVPAELLSAASTNAGFFKYAGVSYMVTPEIDADGKCAGIRLINVTDGFSAATIVPTSNTAFEAVEGIAAAGGYTLATYDELDRVNGADIVLYSLVGDIFTRFSTEGVRQPQAHREFAYDITVAETDDDYTVTFKSTGDAPGSALVLTNVMDPADVLTFEGEAVVKGENSQTIKKAEFFDQQYNVAVKIISKPIAAPGEYYADPAGATKRGGVVTITDPESDNLGYTAVTIGGNLGVKIYAPDGTVSGPFFVGDSRLDAGNQSSMFRGDERNGNAVFADWSDKGAGYWVIDPANPVDMTQLLAGAREGSKGSYAYNGQIIGGGSSCVAFQGKGEEQRMYSFLEDYPNPNTPGKENKVYRYTIGTADQITTVPDKVFENLNGGAFLANQNVEIQCTDEGFFVSQCRSAGNNVSGCPVWAYFSNDGEQLANSGSLDYLVSGNSGIALSPDGKLFATAQYDRITILNVEWNEYGEPSFTHFCDIPYTNCTWGHMRFDAGNNLHAYLRELDGYHAFSLPAEKPESLVPAKAKYVLSGTMTAISDISIDAPAEGPAVFYNLNGVRVDERNLTPGLYIKAQGGKAEKVVIR